MEQEKLGKLAEVQGKEILMRIGESSAEPKLVGLEFWKRKAKKLGVPTSGFTAYAKPGAAKEKNDKPRGGRRAG